MLHNKTAANSQIKHSYDGQFHLITVKNFIKLNTDRNIRVNYQSSTKC